jgi:hypothetical protein
VPRAIFPRWLLLLGLLWIPLGAAVFIIGGKVGMIGIDHVSNVILGLVAVLAAAAALAEIYALRLATRAMRSDPTTLTFANWTILVVGSLAGLGAAVALEEALRLILVQ